MTNEQALLKELIELVRLLALRVEKLEAELLHQQESINAQKRAQVGRSGGLGQ